VHTYGDKCPENVIHSASAHGVLPNKNVTDGAWTWWINDSRPRWKAD